jgi:hypothetical protein
MPCQCYKCGFFTTRHLDTGECIELDDECRETGKIALRYTKPAGGSSWSMLVPDKPFCFVDAHKLPDEIPDKSAASIVSVGHKSRECDKFVPYMRGLSPREHREMKLLEQVQADNRAAQAAMLYQSRESRKAAWWAAGASVASAVIAIGALVVAIIALRHP